jgi:hypothetical protein
MRRFVLITALVLASATAQASSSRGLTMASNDESTSERIETVKPAEAAKPEATKLETTKPEASAPEVAKPEASKPRAAKADGSRSAPKAHGKRYGNYAGDEARARSIAARYGISW